MSKFGIIDIETTGGNYRYGKITEIAIIVFENGKEVNKFESLVNPECVVPPEITRITGITNEMLENAPKFYEIAKQVLEILESCVFVAHNVQFDYLFIKEEFKNLGYNFNKKKLCTVVLSRKYFPGLKSYALGSLIKHFGIEVLHRHRAYDDAWATLQIFKKMLLIQEESDLKLSQFLKGAVQDSKYPPHLDRSMIENLPEACGVYYMLNENGDYIYIGKSIHIKDRIIQHFNETSYKSGKMIRQVHSIEYEITGSELMACLIESGKIKEHNPEINRAQKKKSESYAIIRKYNDEEYPIYLVRHKDQLRGNEDAIQLFSNSKKAYDYLNYLIYQYELCENIQNNIPCFTKPCSRMQLSLCRGACVGKESIEDYTERFNQMHAHTKKFFTKNMILSDLGRNKEELSIIVIENGFCRYLGYIDNQYSIQNIEDLKDQLVPYQGNIESNGIILHYLKKHPKIKCIYF